MQNKSTAAASQSAEDTVLESKNTATKQDALPSSSANATITSAKSNSADTQSNEDSSNESTKSISADSNAKEQSSELSAKKDSAEIGATAKSTSESATAKTESETAKHKKRVVILNTVTPEGMEDPDCHCTPEQMKLCLNHQETSRPVGCPGTDSPECPVHNLEDDPNRQPKPCCAKHKQSDGKEVKEIKGTYKRLVIAAGIASVATAILLIVMKFVVWLISGSSSILASLTDSIIDLSASFINLIALRYALQPADDKHRFGHYKAESLASLTQAAFIGGSALLLIFNGFDRMMNPVALGYLDIAIYVSIASIVVTVVLTMFQGYVCKITKSEAVEADRFHYLSDVGLNLSVIASLVLSKMGYDWADGLITILLGIYIMHSSYHIGVVAVGTLLDKSLSVEDHNRIIRAILSVDGVDSFHDLRTRKAGPQIYIQCHIVLARDMSLQNAHDIANKAEHNIKHFFEDADITLHMEPDHYETFTDIRFIDSQYCQVPKDYYSSASKATEAVSTTESTASAAEATAKA